MSRLIFLLALCAWSAFGQCGRLVKNPQTGKLDCIGAAATGPAAGNYTSVAGSTVDLNTSASKPVNPCVPSSASGTTYTCSSNAAIGSYTDGTLLEFTPDVACSGGATTVNVNSLGAKRIYKTDGATNPAANDCRAGGHYLLSYNSTTGAFDLMNPPYGGTGTCTSGQFATATTTGAPTCAQVDYSQLTGTPPSSQTTILNKQDTLSAATISGETTLFTYTMPSGTLTAGSCIQITMRFNKVSGSNGASYLLYFGATSRQFMSSQTTNSPHSAVFMVCNNNGSTTAQTMFSTAVVAGGGVIQNPSFDTPAENVGSNSTVIKLTVLGTTSDTINPKQWLITKVF